MQERRGWSYLAAGVLAFVTLGVFYVLQYYGPESVVRRLHTVGLSMDQYVDARIPFQPSLLNRKDRNELAESTTASAPQDLAFLMDNVIRPIGVLNGNYQIARIDYQHSDQVTLAVLYRYPFQPPAAMVWIVTLDNGNWKVNVAQTVNTIREMRGH